MSANIALFVPHNGCRHNCSFCNQFSITSQVKQPTAEDVITIVEKSLSYLGDAANKAEIAFFGGSFTAVEPTYMLELLSAAYPYVHDKKVAGIRVSTRPDAVSDEILDLLEHYGVTTVELGAQSICDEVLAINGRGHTVADVVSAANRVKAHGFSLGLQMMTGLPLSNDERDTATCEEFIALRPDFVRIYPTVVLKNTRLADMYNSGEYRPQTVDEAVELCCRLLERFEAANIPVIRLGLHTIDESAYVAGPWHPAFGELCQSRRYFERLKGSINHSGKYMVYASPRALSKAIGQNRCNVKAFSKIGIEIAFSVDRSLDDEEFIIEEVKL